MKLSKTKNYLTALVLGTLFLNAGVVDAVQPKLKPSDIVALQPSEANMFATKRATTRLTQSHYRKFQLDDEFSEKIFDRYLKGLDFNRNTFLQSDIDDLRAKISPKTKIVSVMLANNETGVIQPISKIAEIIREERMRRLSNGEKTPIYLHSDASQGVGQLDISVSRLGVDMLTLNAGKIYGPKQTGLLWANREIQFNAQIVGGGQERNLRSGTENVPSVIGFAKAMQLAEKHRKKENERLRKLKELFKNILSENFSDEEMIFLGNIKKQLASHVSVSFPGIDAERMVFALEMQGVLVATGSACAANKGTRSHTLTAMGLKEGEADGSLRISFGALSNEENTKRAAEIISKTIRAEFERIKK